MNYFLLFSSKHFENSKCTVADGEISCFQTTINDRMLTLHSSFLDRLSELSADLQECNKSRRALEEACIMVSGPLLGNGVSLKSEHGVETLRSDIWKNLIWISEGILLAVRGWRSCLRSHISAVMSVKQRQGQSMRLFVTSRLLSTAGSQYRHRLV